MRRPPAAGRSAVSCLFGLVALAGLAPQALQAQGLRGEVDLAGNVIELRPLVRDSLPDAEVAGEDLQRRLPDGTVATCIPDQFCRWYASGEVESVSILTQDVSLTGWPGIQGLSATVHLRGRYGTDAFWPRSDQRLDAISAYASYERGDYHVRAGRQFRINGLGYYNFDGGALEWRGYDPVRVEVYGGWSLAPNLDAPRDGELLSDADALAPDDRGLLLGIDVQGRVGRRLTGKLTYQREIRSDRLALYTERVAFAAHAQVERVSLDLGTAYDLSFAEFNEVTLRAAAPLPRGLDASVQYRRHRPFFELWTIWGAFTPVGFDEGRMTVGWAIPATDFRLEGGGTYRRYEKTDAGADFVPIEDDGWWVFGRARWSRGPWFADGAVRGDRGFGAARYGGDASVGRRLGPGTWLSAHATTSQSFSAFRFGDQTTSGWGIDGAVRYGDVELRGDWGVYYLSFDGQPRIEDWTQQRGSLGVSYRFGTEPSTTAVGRGAY